MYLLNFLFYYFIIIPISLLPFHLLYGISNGLYILFYYILGYRKKIVFSNIKNSFPQKTKEEQIKICKKFYKHFCDLILESLKTFTISNKEIHKRVICLNPEVLNKHYENQKSVIIAGGHLNNWELFAVAFDALVKHQAVGIYKPLSNKFFDLKMQSTRGKFGLKLLSTKLVKKFFDDNLNNLTAVVFAIDQSPSNPENAYWLNFLNQDTGVLFGTEKYAKEYNLPVVYGRINKVNRGYYSFEFFDITANPRETSYGEITESVTKMLEKDIIATPEYWLWSHRRWKHKRPANK